MDLFVGALHESPVTKNHLIASRPYMYDHLTWCIQKAKPIPKWQHIAYLFADLYAFASIVLIIIILVTVGYFLMVAERKKKSAVDMLEIVIRCALGLSNEYRPQTNSVRVFLAFGIFAGIIFATLVSSILMTIATKPFYRSQIKTIEELLEQDFSLAGDRFTLDKIVQQNKVTRCMIVVVTLL